MLVHCPNAAIARAGLAQSWSQDHLLASLHECKDLDSTAHPPLQWRTSGLGPLPTLNAAAIGGGLAGYAMELAPVISLTLPSVLLSHGQIFFNILSL